MINRVVLIGRAGAEPQFKNNVTKLNLATSEKYKDNSGQQVNKTEWHNLTFFGKLAEIANQYVRKGSLLYIEGKLQTSKYQDKDGKDQYKTEIIVGTMQLLESKAESKGGQPANNDNAKMPSYDYMHIKNAREMDDALEDLPF